MNREIGKEFKPMRSRLLDMLVPVWLIALFFAPAFARAADHMNLEEHLPTELSDAIPTKYRNLELQGFGRWEHTREGEEKFMLVPRLEYGLLRNTQLSVEAPYEFGEAVEDNEFKTIGVELFYNFNQEGFYFPAVALAGLGDFAIGEEEDGTDTTVKLILSKTIGRTATWQRLHLNIAWMNNDDAGEDERTDHYKVIVGYDRLMNADTVLILNYVWEQDKEDNVDINLVEAGLRYQFTPLTVIAAGVGAGIGDDSPDFRATIAFQHSMNAWYLGGR
jgi:hypothetical protein